MHINKFIFEYLIDPPTKKHFKDVQNPANQSEASEASATDIAEIEPIIEPIIAAIELPIDIELVKTTSFAEGSNQAKAEYEAKCLQEEQYIGEILEKINLQLAMINSSQQEYVAKSNAMMIKLALAVAKKVADIALTENYQEVLLANLNKVLALVQMQPAITIRLNPGCLEMVQNKIAGLISDNSFKGLVNFEYDEQIAKFDCNVIWHDGQIEYSKEKLSQQIEMLFVDNS
jgi:flagellar biosynthesis/type III secretory pathway protein FliH